MTDTYDGGTWISRFLVLLLLITALACSGAVASGEEGTLVLDLTPLESEVKLKKKVLRQLEAGGISWGIVDDHLVMNIVDEKYVNARLYKNVYGEQRKFELPAGQYFVTCIGYIPTKTKSTDVEDHISAGAFFNEDVMTFTIQPGKVTRLETTAVYKKMKYNWAVRIFLPDLRVRIFEDDKLVDEDVINERTESSIGWDDYSGPLKLD